MSAPGGLPYGVGSRRITALTSARGFDTFEKEERPGEVLLPRVGPDSLEVLQSKDIPAEPSPRITPYRARTVHASQHVTPNPFWLAR